MSICAFLYVCSRACLEMCMYLYATLSLNLLSVSLCLSVCLSVCMCVCLSVRLCVCASVYYILLTFLTFYALLSTPSHLLTSSRLTSFTRVSGDVLRHLLACMVHGDSSEDLKTKAKRALKAILAKCTHLAALQPLLRDAPMKVQKYVLRQFSQLLPHDVEARRAFVQVKPLFPPLFLVFVFYRTRPHRYSPFFLLLIS